MKKIYSILLLLISYLGFSQTESFLYQRDWASYMLTWLQVYNNDGSIVGISPSITISTFPVLNSYLNPQDTLGNFYFAKVSPQGSLEYIRKHGGTGGTFNDLFGGAQITCDSNKNVYISGTTDHPLNIGTSGVHQPNFNNNISLPAPVVINDSTTYYIPPQLCADGFLIKLDSLGNKVWGTYVNGDQNMHTVKVVEKNNFLYIHGLTSSNNNLSTPNSFYPNRPDTLYINKTRPFIARINPFNGQLMWATYTPEWEEEGIFDTESFAINSLGDIYIADSEKNVIKKISADGTQLLGEYQINEIHSIREIFIDDSDQLIVSCSTTQSTGVATPGAYLTTKTHPLEGCLLKFNSNMEKIWGTYIGFPYDVKIYFDNRKDSFYFISSTSEENFATDGAYQEQPNGGNDLLLLKLNTNGQLVWGTYYGGEGDESGIPIIAVDDDENLYFSAYTYSHTNITTENALFPNYPTEVSSTFGSLFAARFNKTTTASTNDEKTVNYLIYPNPVQDVLYIQSPLLFDTSTVFEVYDLNGKLMHTQKGEYANVNVIFLNKLSAGTYVLTIEHKGNKQSQKFIKK